jgi:hypothetical protein
MTLSSPHYVRVERSRQELARTMGDMRTWLDDHKIQPTAFKVEPTEAGITFDLQFPDEYHATLFQQEFAQRIRR